MTRGERLGCGVCAATRRGRSDVAILPWTAGREAVLTWLAGIPVRPCGLHNRLEAFDADEVARAALEMGTR
jgi:hypothetical protein